MVLITNRGLYGHHYTDSTYLHTYASLALIANSLYHICCHATTCSSEVFFMWSNKLIL